jgi:hypothetical protein
MALRDRAVKRSEPIAGRHEASSAIRQIHSKSASSRDPAVTILGVTPSRYTRFRRAGAAV